MNVLNKKIYSLVILVLLSLFPSFVNALEIDSTHAILYNLNTPLSFSFRATPTTYGSSQARGQI